MEKTKSKHILVVEDETIIAINIVSTLRQFGFQSEFVSDGEAALDSIKVKMPDLVLMDIMLHGEKDGIQVVQEIQEKYDLPVIYLTAYSDDKTLERAKTTEPYGYLIKPFNSRDLFISVEIAIYKAGIQRELKRMQNKLMDSQKWETLGLISAGISHEINNPLTSILNQAELIAEEAKKSELGTKISLLATEIMTQAERIAKIVKHLSSYAQEDTSLTAYLDIKDILHETKSFFHQLFLKEKISWEVITKTSFLIPCNPQKIKHLFLSFLQESRSRLNRMPSLGNKKEISISFNGIVVNEKKLLEIKISDSSPYIADSDDTYLENETIHKILEAHHGNWKKGMDSSRNEWLIYLPTQ